MDSFNENDAASSQDIDESLILPEKECNELSRLMEKKYSLALGDKSIKISAKSNSMDTHVIVVLANPDETYFYPVETRVKHVSQEQTAREAQLFLIDYVDQYLEDYLIEDESILLPIDWSDYSYDAIDFQMKGQIFNRKLEDMATKWLEDQAP